MENINIRFGKRLRELRKKKKLTQEGLAQASGLDYKYIQRLEGKKPSSPTLNSLEKLAKAFGVSPSKLLK
ncbi:MAG: helix-turn-helix transcriptional regulator [Candidatus Omnitrophica bacterium]|nr:helix-turn-helix transcriptional regulator [Candidatus Omnitrophota bacterium]MDD5736741.1 helix-turn-helix transcriptional regulator [Candidatus Omnitrophota bacterium]